MIEWRFKPNSRDDMDIDPIQGEFFTTRDIGNISNAVVREGIQNALDERNKDKVETVRVRIFLSGNKYAVTADKYLPHIETLLPHLKAPSSGLSSMPDFKSDMNFLVFEDFNTKGLEGNPEEFYVENNDGITPHNFYYFWRNVGRSGKTDDKLGRWGLGKTVFPAASAINTFWGLTVRVSDNRKLLMGQAVLRTHNREDEAKTECGYKPYGMFGNFIQDKDYFASPVEQSDKLSSFEELFRLHRSDLPGLSLIIPFSSDEITLDHLAYSVIEQYFYPILEGKLEVEITEEDITILLRKTTLKDAIDKINFENLYSGEDLKIKSKESLIKLFDFAQWTFALQEDDFYKLKELDLKNKPRWNKNLLFYDEATLDILRDKFERGERIAFKVPLKYHPVNGSPKTCYYNAFLEKDISLTKPENLFVRDGITISGITSLDKGLVRGIVIIHDPDLVKMLGDSENPAHTEWQADSRNFKGKYRDGKEALTFIKATLKQLFDRLQRPIEGMQKDLLIDFFSIPIETKENKKYKDYPENEPGNDELNEPEIPLVSPKKRPLIIEKIHTGLKLLKNPHTEEVPESIKLKLGYDVPRGNPISGYQELDFDVSKPPINIESEGVYFTRREKNVLEFNIEEKSYFEIKLTGFDEKRDLFLKVQ